MGKCFNAEFQAQCRAERADILASQEEASVLADQLQQLEAGLHPPVPAAPSVSNAAAAEKASEASAEAAAAAADVAAFEESRATSTVTAQLASLKQLLQSVRGGPPADSSSSLQFVGGAKKRAKASRKGAAAASFVDDGNGGAGADDSDEEDKVPGGRNWIVLSDGSYSSDEGDEDNDGSGGAAAATAAAPRRPSAPRVEATKIYAATERLPRLAARYVDQLGVGQIGKAASTLTDALACVGEARDAAEEEGDDEAINTYEQLYQELVADGKKAMFSIANVPLEGSRRRSGKGRAAADDE